MLKFVSNKMTHVKQKLSLFFVIFLDIILLLPPAQAASNQTKSPALESLTSIQAQFDAAPQGKAKAALPVAVPTITGQAAASVTENQMRQWYKTILQKSAQTTEILSARQRQWLWNFAYMHKVAGLDDPEKLARYDPTKAIGFCFGRSMTTHLGARRMGLAQNSIRYLFALGALDSRPQWQGPPEWRFHVTTLVRGEKNAWYAIDPIMNGPMTAKQWVAAVHQGWDPKRKAQFYLIEPSFAIPNLTTVPDIDKETGKLIVELSFDPSKHLDEFIPRQDLGRQVYELNGPEATQKHFHGIGAPKNPFQFLDVSINDQKISYNDYFVDLLQAFLDDDSWAGAGGPAAGDAAAYQSSPQGMRRSAGPRAVMPPMGRFLTKFNSLGSPMIGRLLIRPR